MADKPFHFFVAWEPAFEEETIRAHEIIIRRQGQYYSKFSQKYVWWGKFRWELTNKGEIDLDPRESYAENTELAKRKVDKANQNIRAGNQVYLYTYNPVPPGSLHLARVQEVLFTFGVKLTDIDGFRIDKNGRPACAHMPDYYFLSSKNKLEECNSCRLARNECQLRFRPNFWFKIDEVTKNPLSEESYNLVYAHDYELWGGREGENLKLAVPNSYPILVHQKDPVAFFSPDDLLRAIPSRSTTGTRPNVTCERGNWQKHKTEFVSFIKRLWNGCKFIEHIYVGSREDGQEPYFRQDPNKKIIIGAYPDRKSNVSLKLHTTCQSPPQQKRAVDHLRNAFAK